MPPGNPDNAHTLSISVNAMRAHLAHGDYMDECTENVDDETNDEEEIKTEVEIEEDENDEGQTIVIELKEELGISQE